MKSLFEKTKIADLELQNRVVMAPMTRSRAIGNVANELIAKHYGQRSSAGLIITEGTSPSPNGLGYARIPALYNDKHVAGWKLATTAAHKGGAKIFVQLMHTGRVSHQDNLPSGAKVLAPSAVVLGGTMWTDQNGMKAHTPAVEMTIADIQSTRDEFVRAAKLAMEAGFDGIELHSANGYLLEQFLHPKTNLRTDQYGGNNRMKFVLEIAEACGKAIGSSRVGIRLSPYGAFNEMGEFPGIDPFYEELAAKLSNLGLGYIHIVDHSSMGAPAVNPTLKAAIRASFKGAYILSGGYDRSRAEHDLNENKGDLVAFGRPFISNPTLVDKLKNNLPLVAADPNTFYTPGEKGYTDYV